MREETGNTTISHSAVDAISASQLLHPAQHFNHPRDVLAAAHLDKDEKRAILASWASDQFAIEAMPIFRHYPGTERAVSYDEILDALKALDGDHQQFRNSAGVSWTSRKPRTRKPLADIAKRLIIGKSWKGECTPTTAEA
jgi:hypothetical protein